MNGLRIGIIREGKVPPDFRVALPPAQCKELLEKYPQAELVVQQSSSRCYTDAEYEKKGIRLVQSVSDCDILVGVKEVPIDQLIPNKQYLFFSHTHKMQPYNKELLKAILERKITLVDYELLTNDKGDRVIAFGRFAGLVGAHNGLLTWGKATGKLELPRVKDLHDFEALKEVYRATQIPPLKIVVTGAGRVAGGAVEIMELLNIKRVSPEEYRVISIPDQPVYVQLDSADLYERADGAPFNLDDFFAHPDKYRSSFAPYTSRTDLMINAIYWDPEAPAFFDRAAMHKPTFSINTIADITCDIEGSIPSTLRATTIADPFMGYDPATGKETAPFQPGAINVMSIDNLPNELSRDASESFGRQLLASVTDELILKGDSYMIEKATIARDGFLGPHFQYLNDWVNS